MADVTWAICRHCGEEIYEEQPDHGWVHLEGGDPWCAGRTTAEPAPRPIQESDNK